MPNRPILETINDFLSELSEKTASHDPGGYNGPSTHPSKDVEDYTREGRTGSRAAENERDVKEDHPGGGVDNTSPNSGGSQDDKQFHIGMNPSATGEDHATERSFKKDKVDPPSTHPSHTAEDQGEKWSSARLPELVKTASSLANEILADFANGFGFGSAPQNYGGQQKQGSFQSQPQQQQQVVAPSSPSSQEMAGRAGYELSNYIGQIKEAQAAQLVEQTIKDAELDADLLGSYLNAYEYTFNQLQKAAEGVDPAMLPPPEGTGGPPPGGDPMAAMGAPMPGEGAEGSAEMPPMPPEGDPGAAPPPEGGEPQITEEEALQALVAAMRDMNVSDGELSGTGNPEAQKAAAAAKAYARSGRFQYREAKTAREQQLRSNMQAYVRELLGVN